jgi:hypothetical protein
MRFRRALGRVRGVAVLVLIAACYPHPNGVLAERAESAITPKEHEAVATAYREEARNLRTEAARHAKLAESLSGPFALARHDPPRGQESEHCRRLSRYLSGAADEADALADVHERIVKEARGISK